MTSWLGAVSFLALALVSVLALIPRADTVQAGAHADNPCLISALWNRLVETFEIDDARGLRGVGAFGTRLNEPPFHHSGTRTGRRPGGTAMSFMGATDFHFWRNK